jgi:hypothetical protein
MNSQIKILFIPIEEVPEVIEKGRLCSFPGCNRKHFTKGYCRAHNKQFLRKGEVTQLNENFRQKFNPKDYIGKQFNNWTVLSYSESDDVFTTKGKIRIRVVKCQCNCGVIKNVTISNLKLGLSKGCSKCRGRKDRKYKEVNGVASSYHPLYGIWRNMMSKCYNSNHSSYRHYGAKGIKVCERWHDLANFIIDISTFPKPDGWMRFNLIDSEKDFSPDNWQWSTYVIKGRRSIQDELTAANLARLTGYTRERIRQLSGMSTDPNTKTYPLKPFILSVRGSSSYHNIIFKPEAIEFLRKRKETFYRKRMRKGDEEYTYNWKKMGKCPFCKTPVYYHLYWKDIPLKGRACGKCPDGHVISLEKEEV